MRKRPPSFDLLIGFEAAARHLSFSKAGEDVFVTQSAISRQVKKLEEHLGFKLFERGHRGLCLTEQGKVLYKVTRDTLDHLSSTFESLSNTPTAKAVRLSTTNAFASLWIVPRLARFKALHPEVVVSISANNKPVELKPGVIDLAIRYCNTEVGVENKYALLSNEEIFPVCSPALLRRSGRALTSVADLANHTLLQLEDTQNEWPWLQWSHWLEGVGGKTDAPKARFRFSHFDHMIQAAAMGHGVALGTAPLMNHLLEEGVLVAPLPNKLLSPRSYFLREPDTPEPMAAEFSDWLKAAIKLAT